MELAEKTLYVVTTPIGNLSDLTPRALEVLEKVEFVAAEDTRVGGSLLAHFGIKKPLVSYYEHNKRERGEMIIARILEGETCALISDAGTPAISDPGEDLAKLCVERGVKVSPIPGVSALITALSASGMPSGRFCFEGFLSMSKKSRREHLADLVGERRTMIFYEAPHKLRATLDDFYKTFGDRKIVLARELTKIHEEFIHTTLSGAIEYYKDINPKGEFVLILEGDTSPKEAPLSRNERYRQKLAEKRAAEEEDE
ncbi:MAG: 16S rRNA (cytidine(1402)-2'-O)-methyltransferase [Clostridia bacterium]|nr:16S rRNA (cytidine(1402)-2'-O)-methyltransferase [Clostridia bacterium]